MAQPGLGRVGDYELVRELGSGGMGAVYLARHGPSGALRALKLLQARGDPELVLRFQREVEAQARVDAHPHVARIHEAGVHEGQPWFAMELLGGGDLAQRLAAGPLPPDEAARLVAALARGLAHVHARGVLHRDLKPSNVLFDDRGAPRLADFGLAYLGDRDSLTKSGALLGTPAYMSPEQVTAGARADERSDVYGLGALLYHALTGRPPFAGPSPLAILEQVLLGKPLPPRRLSPAVPPRLEAVCLRAMAREPGARFPSAAALAEALEGAPGPAPSRARRVVALATASTCLLAALLAAWGLRASPAPDAPPPPSLATSTSRLAAPAPAGTASAPPTTRPGPPRDVAGIPLRALPSREALLLQVPNLDFLDLTRLEDPDSGMAVNVAEEVRRGDPLLSASLLRWVTEHATDPGVQARAWMELAEHFQDGAGVVADPQVVLDCQTKAAELGQPRALVLVGLAHCHGLRASVDLPRAADLLRRAVVLGGGGNGKDRTEAAVGLGWIALRDPGIVSLAEAEAALRGERSAAARTRLARLLLRRGERAEAERLWREVVAEGDHAEAQARLALLLLPEAPQRAQELLRGPSEDWPRLEFSLLLWEEGGDQPPVRARVLQLLRELRSGPGLLGRRAALALALTRVIDLSLGRPPLVDEAEAEAACADAARGEDEVAEEARKLLPALSGR